MALELKFKVDRITSDGTTLYLKDITGDYEVTDNPTGYGAPNEARADLALFVFPYYKSTLADTRLTVAAHSPETVEEFEVTTQGDGWQEFTVIALRLFIANTASIVFEDGEYVYDVDNLQILLITGSVLEADTTYSYTYTEVTDDLEILDPDTYTSDIINYPLVSTLCIAQDKARYNYIKELMDCNCEGADDDKMRLIIKLECFIQGGINDFGKLAYYEAQRKFEGALSLTEYLNC